MNVLIVGSGAREHALAWKLAQSPHVSALHAAPGNAGTAQLGSNWPDVAATDAHGLVKRAREARIGLTVIGPEAALAAGVADAMRAVHIPAFGPSRAAARLESSKSFAKQFMSRWGIPTAAYKVVHDRKQAARALRDWPGGVVVKADGLAAGKGVIVADSAADALASIERWYDAHSLPGGGTTIILEERLEGKEVSVMAVTNGPALHRLAAACDYKRALDADQGPNTGGMGAYSPAADVVDDTQLERIDRAVLVRARDGIQRDGMDFRGCLYAGLMMTARGPYVLEFNARFGDPETQVVLPRLESDLFDLLYGIATGGEPPSPRFTSRACVGVVLASKNYPERSDPVDNLPQPPAADDVAYFWGGSKLANGTVSSAGGRVLTVAALGDTVAAARARAYEACAAIVAGAPARETLRYRADIAQRVAVP
ncbi:MAG: phosphoribosylamine--glycine ligase [Candidatus Eremiobacteraeota bacterium]|nr:phosphoribosylamine--glycine ligase [Candidatus Eremiobacteraeota bacterium]